MFAAGAKVHNSSFEDLENKILFFIKKKVKIT